MIYYFFIATFYMFYSDPTTMIKRQASAFIITYPVNNVIDKESNETKRAIAWEKAFIKLVEVCLFSFFLFSFQLKWTFFLWHITLFSTLNTYQDELLPMVASKNLTLSYSSESSIEEELKRESTADAITILVRACFLFLCVFDLCPSRGKFWWCFSLMDLISCESTWFIFLLIFQISYLVMSAYISLALGDTPRFTSFYISSKVF